MKVLGGELASAQRVFTGRASLLESLRQATVKLSSSSGSFAGSGMLCGVIYPKSSHLPRAIIATAKHNMYVPRKNERTMFTGGGKFPKALPDTFYEWFKTNIKIEYGPDGGGAPKNTADVFGYRDVPGMSKYDDDWIFDLVLVQSADKDLVNFALKYGAFSSHNIKEFNKMKFQGGFHNTRDYDMIQLGYGKQTDRQMSAGSNLAYRLTGWHSQDMGLDQGSAPAPGGYDVKQDDTRISNGIYKNGLLLTANTNSTTMEGDSGGALFLVPKNQTKLFIPIGVTLGENYSTSTIIRGTATRNNAATSTNGVDKLFF